MGLEQLKGAGSLELEVVCGTKVKVVGRLLLYNTHIAG